MGSHLDLDGWHADLQAYMRSRGGIDDSGIDRLVAALREGYDKPEPWWAFLQHEESFMGGSTATLDRLATKGVSLLQLYNWASKLIPKHEYANDEIYIRIWLAYARQQWYRHGDDALETFRTLKSNGIGSHSAHLYAEWASMEYAAGNPSKAISIVNKGLKQTLSSEQGAEADPKQLLQVLAEDIRAGKVLASYPYHTVPWLQRPPASAAQQPGAAHDRPPGHKAVAVRSLRSGSAAGASSASGASPAGGEQGADTAPLRRACPSAARAGGSSGSGSGDHTGRCSAASAGDSGRSGGSQGSGIGEEATVCLRRPGGVGGVGGEGPRPAAGGALPPPGNSSDEPTVVINHPNAASLPTGRLGDRVAVEGSTTKELPKIRMPRRIGLSGGPARRIAVASDASPSAAAADVPTSSEGGGSGSTGQPGGGDATEAALAAARKRKAVGEAKESPAPAVMPPGVLRRRHSPEAQPKALPMGCVPGAKPPASAAAISAQRQQQQQQDNTTGSSAGTVSTLELQHEVLRRPGAGSSGHGAATTDPAASTTTTTGAVHDSAHTMLGMSHRAKQLVSSSKQITLEADAATGATLECGDDDETAPYIGSALALKASAGRPSYAPPRGSGPPSEAAPQWQGSTPVAPAAIAAQREARAASGGSSTPDEIIIAGRQGDSAGQRTPEGTADDNSPTVVVARPRQQQQAAGGGNGSAASGRPRAAAGVAAAAAAAPAVPAKQQVCINASGDVVRVAPGAVPQAQQQQQQPRPPQQQQQRKALVPPPPPPAAAATRPGDMHAPPPQQPYSKQAAASTSRQPLAPVNQQSVAGPPRASAAGAGGGGGSARLMGPPPAVVREDENHVVVRGVRYTKLELVGKGGSSKVFKVMAPNRKIFALKRIKLQGRDPEAATGFLDEITLLHSLKGKSNIIQLYDSEVLQAEGLIYMVLEYGDIDLARLLAKHSQACKEVGLNEVDENFIRLYWQQMLLAVHTIHEARIVHSDLKPANFLVVEGQLKLIDFGIAKAIQSDTTSIARENQVGTLNYMSPEAILGGSNNIRGCPPMKVRRASDIWSLGCILYQMVYGHTPFSHLPFIQKMHAIIDGNHHVAFPPIKDASLLDVIRRCLDRNPNTRIAMQELLEHPFLHPGRAAAAVAAAAAAAPPPAVLSSSLTREQLRALLAQAAQLGGGADLERLSEELFRQLATGTTSSGEAQQQQPRPQPPQQQQQAGRPQAAPAPAPPPPPIPRGGIGSRASGANGALPPPPPPPRALPPPAPAPPPPGYRPAPRAAAGGGAGGGRGSGQRAAAPPGPAGGIAEAAAKLASSRASKRADAISSLESRPAGGSKPPSRLSGRPGISQADILKQVAALRKVEPRNADQQQAARQQQQPAANALEERLRQGLARIRFDESTSVAQDDTTDSFSLH